MASTQTPSLKSLLSGSPYLNYLYSYPHKTAYRPFDQDYDLKDLWQQENKDALFLYFHIPFCEMRCGFCNLFTTSNPQQNLVNRYLDQLGKQALVMDNALGNYQFANIAIGGGTPTYLNHHELNRLFTIASQHLHIDLANTPIGIETSPATVTEERLNCLKENHVNRISIGIESFSVKEANAMGRPQKANNVENALSLIQQAEFDTLNIDLIYGGEGQTVESWLESVQQAIEWQAEEIYLYPLYVRPLTGLGRKGQQNWDDQRLSCYYAAKELLQNTGYQQHSMRMFRKANTNTIESTEYNCQEDGMVGLGCGARSYTTNIHYSSDYAVNKQSILEIIQRYNGLDPHALQHANYGIELDLDEQQRRYLLLSLLQCEGLDRVQYQQRFNNDVLQDFPELWELEEESIAQISNHSIVLNEKGIAYSDVIGTWLYSTNVREKMDNYQCR